MPVCTKCGWEIVFGPGGCGCSKGPAHVFSPFADPIDTDLNNIIDQANAVLTKELNKHSAELGCYRCIVPGCMSGLSAEEDDGHLSQLLCHEHAVKIVDFEELPLERLCGDKWESAVRSWASNYGKHSAKLTRDDQRIIIASNLRRLAIERRREAAELEEWAERLER